MDFGIYPPEINSGRMYTGPGSGPLLAAAQAWGGLADELYTAASGYQSVVSELTSGSWSGPSSAAMVAAAGSYVEWLSATAAQAEETAAQAAAAAAAYEAAFASTVPPPVIAANRSLLVVLVATNFLGQNTPAIAATEAQYAEMWAQDAVAMYGYAGSSAAATVLTPFSSPEQNTDPGRHGQPSSCGQPGHQHLRRQRAEHCFCRFSKRSPRCPTRCERLNVGAVDFPRGPLGTLSDLITIFGGAPGALSTIPDVGLGLLAIIDLPFGIGGTLTGANTDDIISGWNGEVGWPDVGPTPLQAFPATLSNLPVRYRADGVGGHGRGQHDRRIVGAVGVDRRRARRYAPSQ